MAQLTFNNVTYTVDHAVKGSDYIHGYDANGTIIVAFEGVCDFDKFVYSGTYMTPESCADEPMNVVRNVNGILVRCDGSAARHAAQHKSGGADAITAADIGAYPTSAKGIDNTVDLFTLASGNYRFEGTAPSGKNYPASLVGGYFHIQIYVLNKEVQNGSANGYGAIMLFCSGKVYVTTHNWDNWSAWTCFASTDKVVPNTGGTVKGSLKLICDNPYVELVESDTGASFFLQAHESKVYLGKGVAGALSLDSAGNLKVKNNAYDVLHTGNYKNTVTPANIGAAPSGFGLGVPSIDISNKNLITETAGKSGFYRGQNVTNSPSTSIFWWFLVLAGQNGSTVIATQDGTAGILYEGSFNHTATSVKWKQMATQEYAIPATEKAVASGVATLDANRRNVQSPKLHASEHKTGGADALSPADIGAISLLGKGIDSNTDLYTLGNGTYVYEGTIPSGMNYPESIVGSFQRCMITVTFKYGSNTEGYRAVSLRTAYGKFFVNEQQWNKWTGWRELASTSYSVRRSGDTMTGNLTIKNGNPYLYLVEEDTNAGMYLQVHDSKLYIGNGTANSLYIDANGNMYIKGKEILNTGNSAGLYTLINNLTALTATDIANGDYIPVGDVSGATGKKITLTNLATALSSLIGGSSLSIKTGSYTGNGSNRTYNLGGKPAIVFITCDFGGGYNNLSQIIIFDGMGEWVMGDTGVTGVGSIGIASTGFTLPATYFNTADKVYNYFAIMY